ncbi:MAG: hypothetical protein QOH21_3556 [Acidobacteriota bacterium]|jgi:imidazolonepropionase-like amidohydrolase|nr:hypothetical protein [Acidobacteriota bacterium]
MKSVLLALSLLLAVSVLAQPAATPPRVVALKAARMFDGTGNDIVNNAVVIVEGDRIKAIGGAIPAGAEIDLGDVTLLPGFIDAHTHLSGQSGENFYREYFEGLMRHPAEQALLASTFARKTVEAGVTTVRDVGSDDYIDVSLRNAIAAGYIVGPRMLVAVHAIGATGGMGIPRPFRRPEGCRSRGLSTASATAPTNAAPRCVTRSSTAQT